ncbi:hypothetical protein WVIC16_60101 [Weissella viridescens]|nr:hypothetical protein WVIC16_60101 [Weissella viridescens]
MQKKTPTQLRAGAEQQPIYFNTNQLVLRYQYNISLLSC